MIWPVGQPSGELFEIAMRSRELWLELKESQVLDVIECGSIHLAHRADELAVLEEYCSYQKGQVKLLSAEEVQESATLANPRNLLGGMYSRTELRVDPRTSSQRIARWLIEAKGVTCLFNTQINSIDGNCLIGADGRNWRAERIVVCSGSDLQTLFPEVFLHSRLKLCKLQMLRSVSQPLVPHAHPHLASGLTLRHYTSFQVCPSLANLKERVANETPELDRYGIHVMASPFPSGEVILGDSHEYGEEISPFDKSEIDLLLLRELKSVFSLNDWTIQERWHGIYAKHPDLPVFEEECRPGVHVFVGTGGAGMTMSFGLAERAWKQWQGE